METLTKHFESRVAASLDRTGMRTSSLGRQAVGDPILVRQQRPGRSPRLAMACQVPVSIEACSRTQVAPVLPGQRTPELFTEQNGGRPMTRAMERELDAPARVLRLPRVQARSDSSR